MCVFGFQCLDIRGARIGDAGVAALAAGLVDNSTLTHLDISDSFIGETGTRALTDLVEKNTTIKVLNFRLPLGRSVCAYVIL